MKSGYENDILNPSTTFSPRFHQAAIPSHIHRASLNVRVPGPYNSEKILPGLSSSACRIRFNAVSHTSDAFYFHFNRISRLHGCNALWCSGGDNISRQKRHISGNVAENLLNVKDTIFSVVLLLEFAVQVSFQHEMVRIQTGNYIRTEGAERIESLRNTQQERFACSKLLNDVTNHKSFCDEPRLVQHMLDSPIPAAPLKMVIFSICPNYRVPIALSPFFNAEESVTLSANFCTDLYSHLK